MEDRISRELQHYHEICCEKGGRYGRWACMVQRWFHHRDIVSRQVDLYMTVSFLISYFKLESISVDVSRYSSYPTSYCLLAI